MAKRRTCKHCGASIAAREKKCPECGALVPARNLRRIRVVELSLVDSPAIAAGFDAVNKCADDAEIERVIAACDRAIANARQAELDTFCRSVLLELDMRGLR